MSPELSGPYRQDDEETLLLKRERKINELESELRLRDAELSDTQQSLANERLENRLLRGTTRVKRGGLLIFGILRYGFTRSLSVVAGAVFTATLLMTLSHGTPPPTTHHTHRHRSHPTTPLLSRLSSRHDRQYPTMIAASALFDRWFTLRCYSPLMCHESCASVPDWTWGGEIPTYPINYQIEVDLVVLED